MSLPAPLSWASVCPRSLHSTTALTELPPVSVRLVTNRQKTALTRHRIDAPDDEQTAGCRNINTSMRPAAGEFKRRLRDNVRLDTILGSEKFGEVPKVPPSPQLYQEGIKVRPPREKLCRPLHFGRIACLDLATRTASYGPDFATQNLPPQGAKLSTHAKRACSNPGLKEACSRRWLSLARLCKTNLLRGSAEGP